MRSIPQVGGRENWQEMSDMTSPIGVDWSAHRIQMYRIVKRVVRTITVVTWAVRYANADGRTVEEEVTLPEIHQVSVQALPDPGPPIADLRPGHDTDRLKG